MGLFYIMKKYIIAQDVLTKVKALLKVKKNVVIEYNELNGIISKLEKLEEVKEAKKKRFYYDVYFTGVSPVTDVLHEKNVLITSKEDLSMDQIEQMIWKKFKYIRVSANIETISKDQFEYLKNEIPLITEY